MSNKTNEFFDQLNEVHLDAYAMEIVDKDYRPWKITGFYVQDGILKVEIDEKPYEHEVAEIPEMEGTSEGLDKLTIRL